MGTRQRKGEQCQYLCSLFIHFHNERGEEGGLDLISVKINDCNCSSGRILQLLQYPIHKVLCTRIDSRRISTSTATAVGNDSNEIETLHTSIVKGHQRTSGIALARILTARQDTSADHSPVELIVAEIKSNGLITPLAHLILQHRHHQFLQHIRCLATLLCFAPTRDKRIRVHIRFGTQLW